MSDLARKLAALGSFAADVNACRLHGAEGTVDPDPARCPACREAQATLDAVAASADLNSRFAAAQADVMAVLEATAAGVDQAAAAAGLVRRIRGF